MNETTRSRALLWVIVGYGLVYFDFNLTSGWLTLPLLPDALGYWLLLRAIDYFQPECADLAVLKNFGWLLLITSCKEVFGSALADVPYIQVVYLVLLLVNLYFHFQFVTNLAMVLTSWDCFEESAHLLRLRTHLVVGMVIVQGLLVLVDVSQLAYWGETLYTGANAMLTMYLLSIPVRIGLTLYTVRQKFETA